MDLRFEVFDKVLGMADVYAIPAALVRSDKGLWCLAPEVLLGVIGRMPGSARQWYARPVKSYTLDLGYGTSSVMDSRKAAVALLVARYERRMHDAGAI